MLAKIRDEIKISVTAVEEKLNQKIEERFDGVDNRVKTVEVSVADVRASFDEKLKTVEEKIGDRVNEYRAGTEDRVQEIENRGIVVDSKLEELAGKDKEIGEKCVQNFEVNNAKIDECTKKTAEVAQKVLDMDRKIKNLKNTGEGYVSEPEVRNVSFSGKERFPIQFLNIMKEISENTGSNNLNWIDRYLKEEAFIWWQLHRGSVKNFNEFEVVFREKYFNEIIQAKIRDRLEFGRYHGRMGEEAISYVENVMLQCSELSPPLTEDQLVYKAGKHFHPNILIAIITRGIKKKQEFIKLLMEFEHAKIEQLNERENTNRRNFPDRGQNDIRNNWGRQWNDRGTPWRDNSKQLEWTRTGNNAGPGSDPRSQDRRGFKEQMGQRREK